MSDQIPLPIAVPDRFHFDQYLAGPNADAVNYLKSRVQAGTSGVIYFWGEPGTGKSHLLQATCHLASLSSRRPAYLCLKNPAAYDPDILGGLDSLDLVCLDDLEAIRGNRDWEHGVFHLHNRLLQNDGMLLVSANTSPAGIALGLPDLNSRLAAAVVWHLSPLGEQDRLEAIRHRARHRGFDLPDEVIDYLSRRVARDMHSLFGWLDRLDQASLSSKKKLTVPFVRALLEDR